MKILLNEIKLSGESEFVKKFNHVSELLAAYNEEGITDEEAEKRFEAYFNAKLALEQGY